jgi:hypothetical protein
MLLGMGAMHRAPTGNGFASAIVYAGFASAIVCPAAGIAPGTAVGSAPRVCAASVGATATQIASEALAELPPNFPIKAPIGQSCRINWSGWTRRPACPSGPHGARILPIASHSPSALINACEASRIDSTTTCHRQAKSKSFFSNTLSSVQEICGMAHCLHVEESFGCRVGMLFSPSFVLIAAAVDVDS